MSAFEEGAPVTIELNEAGKVIDIHRFTVEMSFDEHPRTKPGYVIQVNGTVTKIQSGLIVYCPVGGVSSIIGGRGAGVGAGAEGESRQDRPFRCGSRR